MMAGRSFSLCCTPTDICGSQLKGSLPEGATAAKLVVAYDPVWAIGTGLTPTAGDIEQIHKFVRQTLIARFSDEGANMRILYGGSVKPSNAAELMVVANVNGGNHTVPTVFFADGSALTNPSVIIRRYREGPAPMVRDVASGWRSGRLDAVLGGDFDLMGAVARRQAE